jgi:hypothetical protein
VAQVALTRARDKVDEETPHQQQRSGKRNEKMPCG